MPCLVMPISTLPLSRPTSIPPVCARAGSRNATPTPAAHPPAPPSTQHRLTRTSPGSRPSDTEQSGPGAEPFSFRVVGGAVLVSLPSLSGPERGCIWVSLGGARPARDRRGERGGDDSIFQVFGVSELRPVQFLISLAPSQSGSRSGCREGPSLLSGTANLHTLQTVLPHPHHAHTFSLPHSRLPGQETGPSAPGKERWNSSRPPRVPGLPSFPVINGGATSQLLHKMLHPRAPAYLGSLWGPDAGPRVSSLPQGAKAERQGSWRPDQGWGADPRRAPCTLPRFLPT